MYLFLEEIQMAFVAEDACEVLTVKPGKVGQKKVILNQKQTQNPLLGLDTEPCPLEL